MGVFYLNQPNESVGNPTKGPSYTFIPSCIIIWQTRVPIKVVHPSINKFTYLVPGYITELVIFNTRSVESKNAYLQELGGKGAEDFIAENGINVDDIFDDVLEMIGQHCSPECQEQKNDIFNKILEVEEENKILEKENEKTRELAVKILTAASKLMKDIGKASLEYRESKDPEEVKKQSIAKVDKAYRAGLITKAQKKQLSKQINGAFAFDPLSTTSYKQIVDNVQKGNDISFNVLILIFV